MAHAYNNFNPSGPFNEVGRPLGMCNCGRWVDSIDPIQPCPNATAVEATDFQNELSERVSKLTAAIEKVSHTMELLGPTILETTFEDTNPYRSEVAALGDQFQQPPPPFMYPLQQQQQQQQYQQYPLQQQQYLYQQYYQHRVVQKNDWSSVLNFRETFITHMGYRTVVTTSSSSTTTTTSSSISSNNNTSSSNLVSSVKVKCMISGVESNLPDSICTMHILPPHTSSPRLLRMLKLQPEDLHSARNGLLLAHGIEQAFQQLEVSFVRKPCGDKNALVMKVWGAGSTHCTTRPLFKTSKMLKVSGYHNAELKLNFVGDRSGCHKPFFRALAFQAFQAYQKWKHLDNAVTEPVDYSSDSDTPFSSLRRSLDFLSGVSVTVKLPEYDIDNAEDYVHDIKHEGGLTGGVEADEKIFFHDTSIDYSAANDYNNSGDNNATGSGTIAEEEVQQEEEEDNEQLAKRLKVEPLDSLVSLFSYKVLNHRSLLRSYGREYGNKILHAKIAKKEEDTTKQTEGGADDGTVKVPFNGLMGFEQGSMFSTPLKIYDPLDDIDDLPGEEGSDEKIAAIQKRIDDKVAALRKSGEWNDEEIDNYGKDPLRGIALPNIMLMQLKACKPFESRSDLLLNYLLLIATTVVIGSYVVVLRDGIEVAMNWYVKTDFDSDFLSNLFGGSQ